MADIICAIRKQWVLAAVGAMAVAAAVAVSFACSSRQAVVTGSTPKDRIESICRLADEKPAGAADAIAKSAATDIDPSVRRTAVLALAKFHDPKYRPVIAKSVTDASPEVRAAAAAALGDGSDAEAAEQLAAQLSDADLSIRLAACRGLGRNKSPQSVVYLMEAVEGNSMPEVQLEALRDMYGKFYIRYTGDGPSDPNWADHAESAKMVEQVKNAYKEAGKTLVMHPERIRPEARGEIHPKPAP